MIYLASLPGSLSEYSYSLHFCSLVLRVIRDRRLYRIHITIKLWFSYIYILHHEALSSSYHHETYIVNITSIKMAATITNDVVYDEKSKEMTFPESGAVSVSKGSVLTDDNPDGITDKFILRKLDWKLLPPLTLLYLLSFLDRSNGISPFTHYAAHPSHSHLANTSQSVMQSLRASQKT